MRNELRIDGYIEDDKLVLILETDYFPGFLRQKVEIEIDHAMACLERLIDNQAFSTRGTVTN